MSCLLDIPDLVEEMLIGTVVEIAGLPEIQVAGVLAAVRKTVDQDADAITDKGLGLYGLSVEDLQLTGIVKCGVDPEQLINDILEDPSVFTGKDNVTSSLDLTGPEEFPCDTVAAKLARDRAKALQQKLMMEVMAAKMANLALQGVTGVDDQETATYIGQSSKFSPFDIIANIAGTIGDVAGSVIVALGLIAAAGALIGALKNADILGKLKGFGKKIASLPELATDTLASAMSAVNSGVDSIIGSSKIPSAGDPTITANAGAAGISAGTGGLLDTATDAAGGVLDLTSEIPKDKYV